ncbi:hypothetical protein [Sagittula salina]|uniref:Uncharacterized protein n=1 Tax=Sagittula salina TaxID=2820268 RepID=A0A940S2G2_9RHOB|nr:hypothetical protein [Sagittula salina]MBP0481625.1 hypothetical protein [Sagittula salina]
MVAKLVLLFLVIMGVIGIFGGWKTKSAKRLRDLGRMTRLDAQKCPACGRYNIGKGPCACGREKR